MNKKYDFEYAFDERTKQMIRLREQGWSYPAIAKNFGLSRQRVYQLIGNANIVYFRPITEKQCVFKGLRDWLNKKSVSRSELLRRMYGCYHPVTSNRFANYLTGRREMSMSIINKILSVTGLTYEQAFGGQDNAI